MSENGQKQQPKTSRAAKIGGGIFLMVVLIAIIDRELHWDFNRSPNVLLVMGLVALLCVLFWARVLGIWKPKKK